MHVRCDKQYRPEGDGGTILWQLMLFKCTGICVLCLVHKCEMRGYLVYLLMVKYSSVLFKFSHSVLDWPALLWNFLWWIFFSNIFRGVCWPYHFQGLYGELELIYLLQSGQMGTVWKQPHLCSCAGWISLSLHSFVVIKLQSTDSVWLIIQPSASQTNQAKQNDERNAGRGINKAEQSTENRSWCCILDLMCPLTAVSMTWSACPQPTVFTIQCLNSPWTHWAWTQQADSFIRNVPYLWYNQSKYYAKKAEDWLVYTKRDQGRQIVGTLFAYSMGLPEGRDVILELNWTEKSKPSTLCKGAWT